MRVLINAIHAKSGGGVTYMRRILHPLGTLAGPQDSFEVLGRPEQSVLVEGAPPNVTFLPVWCPRIRGADAVLEQGMLPFHASMRRADIIFCPQNYGPVLSRVPVVLLLRTSLEVRHTANSLAQRAFWRMYLLATGTSIRRATRVISVSETLADEMRGLFDLPPSFEIPVVPHGIHPVFCPGPGGENPMSARGGGRYFLFVSDLLRHKNLHGLVTAFAGVAADAPDCRLVVIGRDLEPEYVEHVHREAARLGVAERIEWLGPVEQDRLPDWYRHSIGLVYPSFAESFGRPPLEAMACGVPVLVSRSGAMPEICGDGAAFFDPSQPQEIAEQMRALLRQPGFAETLGRAGLERSREFSWQKCAASLLEILRATARGPRRPAREPQPHTAKTL
jgi:glycosyltransferase involved in cell wall biosynthesis